MASINDKNTKNTLKVSIVQENGYETIENIWQDEENLYYAPNRSSGDGDDVMQSLAHHQHHIDLHASRRLIQSDDHYLDQDGRRVSRRQEMIF